ECNSILEREEGEAQHYCKNEAKCPPQIIGKIQHFIGRKAMDIEGLGSETVAMLFNEGIINNLADLYRLNKDHLLPLERMADKSVSNLLEGIEKSKEKPFAKVLFGLGIRFVGETVAKTLAKKFQSIDNLAHASLEELTLTDDIGERIAQSVKNYFSNPLNQKQINFLKSKGLQMEIEEQKHQISLPEFDGKRFVISGVFTSFSREELKNEIERFGGKIVSSVSSKTDFIIAGEGMGPSKKIKAENLGIPILDEEEYLKFKLKTP
ncbi:MAG: helix-hairpin-helix domain-containing protein, partial [Flavobacteriaceae bacterium]